MQNGQLANSASVKRLAETIDEARALLKEIPSQNDESTDAALQKAPASLLDECMSLCNQYEAIEPEPIRTIHHFACTGGTLISKCLAAMPNVQMLSEVDPLSTMQAGTSDSPQFAPTDMIQLMRQSTRGTHDDLLIDMFLDNIELVYARAVRKGWRLIIRDHAHSHFCADAGIPARSTLRDILVRSFPIIPLVTVRHPLDSYMSLRSNGWAESVGTLDEYCKRYLSFLEANSDSAIIKYEHVVNDQRAAMATACDYLELPYLPDFKDLYSAFALTGDSGRSGNVISPRSRRVIPSDLVEEQRTSQSYQALLEKLAYSARVNEPSDSELENMECTTTHGS